MFGLDSTPEEAGVHLIGVPFDATTSFRRGTAGGPAAIRHASHQVDLFDALTGRPYEAGIWMPAGASEVEAWNAEARALADPVLAAGGPGDDPALAEHCRQVDRIQTELNAWVERRTEDALERGKLVGVVGGDHSTPLGALRAHARRHPGLGVLHVDAHADLREAYEGFAFSHASILYNATESIAELGPVLQVGVRDLCDEELGRIASSGGRIRALYDHEWARVRLAGGNLRAEVRRALVTLPAEVYVTFDVDGLDPALCPNTGTPVPGGLAWDEAMLWLEELVASGRRIVGFDLTEVAPGEREPPGAGWDEIVGARLLYRLIGFALRSR